MLINPSIMQKSRIPITRMKILALREVFERHTPVEKPLLSLSMIEQHIYKYFLEKKDKDFRK